STPTPGPGVAASATLGTARPRQAAPAPTPEDVLPPVLAAAGETDVAESTAELARRIAAVDTHGMGGSWTGAVVDVDSGTTLYGHNRSRAYTPASTMKLLTSVSALQLLGPQHRFTTSVVAGSGSRIVLVGGGDPYLALKTVDRYPTRASLTTLANSTAAALKKAGRTKVSLGYDTSLFSGPARNPRWPSAYGDQVTSISALWVDEGRSSGYSPGPRVDDPAGTAAQAFATALEKKGVQVAATTKVTAPRGAARLAAVDSMPVSQIVEQLLLSSDNDAAEVMLRQLALAAGHPGSFSGGVAAVQETLTTLGVWADNTRIYDGSGLARDNKVSADVLTHVVRVAAAADRPRLRALLTGLPTASVDGSLRLRYGDDAGRAARGVLRAKTGTLTKVHGLAGYVLTKDGSVLAFAFVVNDMKKEYASVKWLDHVTAAVAGCGCRA
ncbi:MAG: D-alanyl-D-alanine carboxypeptidase/D-alanyl-D-alanine endopeptidase, partial [Propionibacteriaceae bacterium]